MLHAVVACMAAATLFGLVYLWDNNKRSQVISEASRVYRSLLHQFKSVLADVPSSGESSGKETPRQFGQWTPDTDFRYPSIQALSQFNIEEVEPIPYRPFR